MSPSNLHGRPTAGVQGGGEQAPGRAVVGGTGGSIGVAVPGSQAEASPPAQPQPLEAPGWDDGVTRGSVFPSQGHGTKG